MVPETATDLLQLFTRVADPARRREAARDLAAHVGADAIIFFIADSETGTLLPGPGFPQTLPGRKAWRRFLDACIEEGTCTGEVTYPDRDTVTPALGVAGADGSLLVALGDDPDRERMAEARHFLPLLAAAQRGEQAVRTAAGRAKAVHDSATQLNALARSLDAARVELQDALHTAATANERMEHELSERQRVEEELQRQTELLQSITDNATTALMMMDTEGRGTFWNPAAEEMMGYTAAEVIGTNLHELFHHHHPDGRPFPAEECPIDRALPDGLDVRGYEDHFIRKDGTFFPVLCSARPILGDGQPIGTVIEVRDLTAQKLAEASLRESERRYRLAARATSDAVWDWDLELGELEWNEALGTLFGYEAEAREGTTVDWWTDHVHPEDRARVSDGLQATIDEQREHWHDEYRFRRSDGTYAYVVDRGFLLRRPDGTPLRMIGAMLDLTDRKQIEESLREETHILETINRVNARLAGELDLEKLVQSVTDAGTELTGARLGAFCYKVLGEQGESSMLHMLSSAPHEAFDRFPMPRDAQTLDRTFQEAAILRSDDVARDPRYAADAASEEVPENALPVRSYLAVSVRSRSGDVLGGLFFGHEQPAVFDERTEQLAAGIADQASIALENARLYRKLQQELTERKNAEARLKELNETLEERVASRTAELERTNLALRKSNRDLQDFAYVASHDLQEPLRKIQTFANLLELDCAALLNAEQISYVERMDNAAARMSQLIQDLLSFSRVTTKGSAFLRVDLDEIVRDVLSDLEIRIQETGGKVELDDLPSIQADPTQMRQLFQNLIGNALKFHRPDVPPVIRVLGRLEKNAAGGTLHLVVEDNGIGFDEQYVDRVFAPFQRLHSRSAFAGTGMGLAICRRIVERHHGTITARSRPGEGSTFIITLPASQNADAEASGADVSV